MKMEKEGEKSDSKDQRERWGKWKGNAISVS